MMYPKPKSAPGRMTQQSKLAKNRSNAMKEMEDWARKADDSTSNASRMSGQLTDNVTEERMLRAKLRELSKERYKFLAQNAYEKKVFTDRIQRRSSTLLGRASSAALSTCSDGEPSRTGKITAIQRWQTARQALLERMDTTKRKGGRPSPSEQPEDSVDSTAVNKEDDKEEKGDAKRQGSAGKSRERIAPEATPATLRPGSGVGSNRLAPLPSAPSPGPAVDREERLSGKPPLSPLPSANSRNVKFDKSSKDQPASARQSSVEARGLSPRRIPFPGFISARPPSAFAVSSKPNSATSQRSKPSTILAATHQLREAGFRAKQGILANRDGVRLESKTKDPRYSMLEKSLSPLQKRRSHADVTSIVQSFDSLHVPPRRRKEAKPKIELKALEYMEEQGFLFFNV